MVKLRVSDLLGKYKMTQKELSDKTGIRPATISAYYNETAKHIVLEHIDKLCEAFNCDVTDLLECNSKISRIKTSLNSFEENNSNKYIQNNNEYKDY
jgi:putative transcriptional regulator